MASDTSLAKEAAELQGSAREHYVSALFDRIASPYDRLNRIISLGRDGAWRRRVVALSGVTTGQKVCDMGTGTGDLALCFARRLGPEGQLVGVDISAAMLRVAKYKMAAATVSCVHLVRASAASVGLPDGWAHAVSMGWVLRNVGDRGHVYTEIRRLLRPGGRFVSVEMSHPASRLGRMGFWAYRHLAMPVLIRLFSGDAQAYKYLASSTDRFPDALALDRELEKAGFRNVYHIPLMGGAVAIHVATNQEPRALKAPTSPGR